MAIAHNNFPLGENFKLAIPFYKGYFIFNFSSMVVQSHIKILGLGPTSPVATKVWFGCISMAVISSICLLKNY